MQVTQKNVHICKFIEYHIESLVYICRILELFTYRNENSHLVDIFTPRFHMQANIEKLGTQKEICSGNERTYTEIRTLKSVH